MVDLAAGTRLRAFALPYPPAAQLLFDRIVLRCLGRGETPPRSLPDLLMWCRDATLGHRLFGLPQGGEEQALVHPDRLLPSRTCLEWASHGEDGTPEQQAVRILAELADRCGPVDRYRQCRAFLARHPSVSIQDRFPGSGRWNPTVWNQVKHLYHPVPENLLRKGVLALCAVCRMPALSKNPLPESPSGTAPVCESESCGPAAAASLIREPGRHLLLEGSLRVFLALPHRTERDVLARLARAGITPTFLPSGLGAHRIEGEGTGRRLMKVYDRRQPALLASRVTETSAAPDEGRVLVVVPRQTSQSPGYRAAFEAGLGTGPRGRAALVPPEGVVRSLRDRRTSRKEEKEENEDA
ncbi:hypothetical protein BU197_25650 [Streptomyces sp. CBMA291]|nr:hypothetical protein [Streptomyces sp. CBMA291]MBD0714817.1 hypothetical protein [Streptomyces sp. CBMA370]